MEKERVAGGIEMSFPGNEYLNPYFVLAFWSAIALEVILFNLLIAFWLSGYINIVWVGFV